MTEPNTNSDAGLGDPYWYEWSIGQSYIIDMLDPDSGIESVTLQRTGDKGLDDVVVCFRDGASRFIQIKHTRAEDTLTFGDLVAPDGGEPSLLRQIAEAWKNAQARSSGPCGAWLVTNRLAGRRHARSAKTGITRPSLDELLAHLRHIEGCDSLADAGAPPSWQAAWNHEWMPQLECLESETHKLVFLKSFQIRASQEGLDALTARLVERLAAVFSVHEQTARGFLARLDTGLRRWSTSLRGNRESVTREVAFEQLCLTEDKPVGEHDLVPPEPFFPTRLPIVDEIADLLQKRVTPIVFVSGEPGSGKTALLSALSNRRDPVIGARFYAYRPITPDRQLLPADADQTTKARALWSDLFLQVRALCRGRLAALRVPVHADSLTTEALRDHVLRLANAVGAQEGRPFVLAVDGIDHAARAGLRADTLLESLVPPDQVPPNVVFVIGGQPPEGYAAYPLWLRAPTTGVRRFDLARLTIDDTRTLVRSRLGATDTHDLENVVRHVWKHCSGHTLATVFAVEEAALASSDLARLSSALEARRLSSGIEEYYRAIWESATRQLSPGTAIQLAACIALSPSRVTAEAACEVAGDLSSAIAAWIQALRGLRPLIVADNGAFRVFHNDVRVFLHRTIQGDPDTYRECAGRLAEHLRNGKDAKARHAAALKLFGIAGNARAQATLFGPHYVLEGHAVGSSLDVLTAHGLTAAEALPHCEHDWDLVHQVVTGLLTLEQLRKCLEWRNAKLAADSSAAQVTRLVERRVPLPAEWSRDVVSAALRDILDLCALGEDARARGAFARWFSGLSPLDVEKRISEPSDTRRLQSDEDGRRAMATQLGSASALTMVLLPASDSDAKEVESGYARGLLADAWRLKDDRDFVVALRAVRWAYAADIQGLVTRLVDLRAWRRCAFLLGIFGPHADSPWSFRLQAAGVAAILGTRRLRERCIEPILAERSVAIEGAVAYADRASDSGAPDQLTVMAWAAFLIATEEPHRDASAIREEIHTAFCRTRRDERDDDGVSQLLHASAVLGSLVRTMHDGRAAAIHVDSELVSRTARVLMGAHSVGRLSRPFGFVPLANLLVRGLAECVTKYSGLRCALRDEFVTRLSRDDSAIAPLEAIWPFLLTTGNRSELISYANQWIASDGRAWHESPSDRYEVVSRFVQLLEESGEQELASYAVDRLAWADVGYIDHKEYALSRPLDWFEIVVATDPAAWRDDGLRLFALSREATRTADNRFASSVETAVLAAACIEGPEALASLVLAEEPPIEAGDPNLIRAILRMAKAKRPDHDLLLAVWAFCTGQLSWELSSDGHLLAQVRDALVSVGDDKGIADLATRMRQIAPAEFACKPEDHGTEEVSSVEDTPADARASLLAACADERWSAASAALQRVIAEGGMDARGAVQVVYRALRKRSNRVWWYDSADDAYAAIVPLLTHAELWELATSIVETREYEAASHALTVAENLDNLCRLRAKSSAADVRRGLNRLLAMHELWISGDGHLAGVAPPKLAASATSAMTWSTLFMELLFRHLAFDGMSGVEASLRGIYRLLTLSPTLSAHAISLADSADVGVRRRFLMLAEALILGEQADVFRPWLRRLIDDPRLDIGLAAWSALRMSELARGTESCPWPAPDADPSLIIVAGRGGLVVRPEVSNGLHRNSARPAATLLRYLEAAGFDDVESIEGELAASLRDEPLQPRPRRLRDRQRDLVASVEDEAELDRLFRILKIADRQGRLQGVEVSRLAQALVPAADPFVFLHTPVEHSHPNEWLVDDLLDKEIGSEVLVRERLVELLHQGLPKSRKLISGCVSTFSSKFDAHVVVHHAVDHRPGPPGDPPSILNGRSSLAFHGYSALIASAEPRARTWLTRSVGGLFSFPGAMLDVFPGSVWSQWLMWSPDPGNPLIWTHEGEPIAFFERLCGPVRRIYPSDFVHRQPTLSRWSCTEDGWNQIMSAVGTPVRHAFFEAAPAGLR